MSDLSILSPHRMMRSQSLIFALACATLVVQVYLGCDTGTNFGLRSCGAVKLGLGVRTLIDPPVKQPPTPPQPLVVRREGAGPAVDAQAAAPENVGIDNGVEKGVCLACSVPICGVCWYVGLCLCDAHTGGAGTAMAAAHAPIGAGAMNSGAAIPLLFH